MAAPAHRTTTSSAIPSTSTAACPHRSVTAPCPSAGPSEALSTAGKIMRALERQRWVCRGARPRTRVSIPTPTAASKRRGAQIFVQTHSMFPVNSSSRADAKPAECAPSPTTSSRRLGQRHASTSPRAAASLGGNVRCFTSHQTGRWSTDPSHLRSNRVLHFQAA
jgi:hypothetical protein